MKPIGLTLKNIKHNPYTDKISGEIMVVHLCLACGKIACNRIAGDDNPYAVINLLKESEKLNDIVKTRLSSLKIGLLSLDDEKMVSVSLLGNCYDQTSLS